MAISGISNVGQISSNLGVGNASKSAGFDDFKKIFEKAIEDLGNIQTESTELTKGIVTGQNDNIHQAMVASEKAEVALQFTMQIRNKILDAYTEIMRMQI